MQIVNRKKELVQYDPQRIRSVITQCMAGLDNDTQLSTHELEAAIGTRIIDGVTTTQEIQNNAIDAALALATDIESSEWLKVAGALNLWDLNKQIDAERPPECKESLKEVIRYQVKRGFYSQMNFYDIDLDDFDTRTKDIEPDLEFDYAGSQLLRKRYLLPHEKPAEMFKVCALKLAHTIDEAVELYRALAKLKISLATPFLSNLRSGYANLSSCFITKVEDNLESITDKLTQAGFISKNGGGVGINLSSIRAKGSSVDGVKGASGGVTPWIKLFNDMMSAVSQVKSNRKGAATVAIEVWHQDILDFLELQTENGDLRQKAYDIFPQVVVNDLFMIKVLNDDDWCLFDPYELSQHGIELVKAWGSEWWDNYHKAVENPNIKKTTIKAKDLLKTIMKTTIETGLPYLFFKDTVNEDNVNRNTGTIPSANLCMESFSNFSEDLTHCCNLVSVNLARVEDDRELSYLTRLAVRVLNKALSLTNTPDLNSYEHNDNYRTIGVGVMGLCDYLAKRKLEYTPQNVEPLFKKLSFNAVFESCELAKRHGPYYFFKANKENWLKRVSEKYFEYLECDQLLEDIEKYGLRNGQLLAIAPNSSTSILYGATASVLPPFNLFFTNKDGHGTVPVVAPFARTHAQYYTVNKDFDQQKVVEVIASIQKYVDQGVSMELVFDLNNPEFDAKYLYDTINLAWQLGCKTIYYIRTVQKTIKEQCSVCAN